MKHFHTYHLLDLGAHSYIRIYKKNRKSLFRQEEDNKISTEFPFASIALANLALAYEKCNIWPKSPFIFNRSKQFHFEFLRVCMDKVALTLISH